MANLIWQNLPLENSFKNQQFIILRKYKVLIDYWQIFNVIWNNNVQDERVHYNNDVSETIKLLARLSH